jgi:hypothetical protein
MPYIRQQRAWNSGKIAAHLLRMRLCVSSCQCEKWSATLHKAETQIFTNKHRTNNVKFPSRSVNEKSGVVATLYIGTAYKGVSKSFWTGRLERELQMVQLSATRCSCIAT